MAALVERLPPWAIGVAFIVLVVGGNGAAWFGLGGSGGSTPPEQPPKALILQGRLDTVESRLHACEREVAQGTASDLVLDSRIDDHADTSKERSKAHQGDIEYLFGLVETLCRNDSRCRRERGLR